MNIHPMPAAVLLCLSLLFSTPGVASGVASGGTPGIASGLPAYSQHYDPKRDPFADGREAIALAESSGRHILIEVGGDWCSWCHILDRFIKSDADILARLHNNFVVLKINVSDQNANEEFMQGFPRPLGYPHMYVARGNGSLIHSQDTAKFLHQGKYQRDRLLAFLKRWSPQP